MHRQAWVCMSLVACLLCSLPIAAEPPRDVVLLLDNTANMKPFDKDFLVRRLARGFGDEANPPGPPALRLALGLLGHDSELLPLLAMTKENQKVIAHSLRRLKYQDQDSNLPEMIGKAIDELAHSGSANSAKSVVVLAAHLDAMPRSDPAPAQELPEILMHRIRRENVKLFWVAVASDKAAHYVRSLAETSGGAYFAVQRLTELPAVFARIDALSRSEPVTVDRNSVLPQLETLATKSGRTLGAEERAPSSTAKGSFRKSAYAPWVQWRHDYPVAMPGALVLLMGLVGYTLFKRRDPAATEDVMLEQRDDGCWLLVGKKAAATYVNERLMRGELRLQPGDRIKVAELEFALSNEDLQHTAALTGTMQPNKMAMDAAPRSAPRTSMSEATPIFSQELGGDERSAHTAKTRLRTELAAMRAALAPDKTDPLPEECNAPPFRETPVQPHSESNTDVPRTPLLERGTARTAKERLAAALSASGNLRH